MAIRTWRLFVDGKWTEAASGATYAVPNPATEETVALAPDAGREDVARALLAARRAFDSGPWRRSTPAERARILLRIADAVEKRKEEFRGLLVAAHGAEAMTHGIQLDTPIAQLRGYAELTTRFTWDEPLTAVQGLTAVGMSKVQGIAHHQPAGVCGLIPTWNFPLYVTAQKVGPAIATGCTMVVKPSPWGPLVDLLLAEIIAECDLPPGVFNIVTGLGPELGAELAESPLVDKISFTGSVSVGKKVALAAAGTLKRVHLELGGKSAQIVLDDFEVDAAAPSSAGPTYFHAGQGCAMTTRVLVQRRRHDALVEKMAAFVRAFVKVGDPADPTVILGPLIREERRQAVAGYVASGRAEGAELVCGGAAPAAFAHGFFFEPTIFANVRNDMRIAREEIFGPVVSVIPFEDEEDAIRIANESSLGLFGGILTRDLDKARAIAKRIRAGGVSINGAVNLTHAPFGGFKESGIGREGGIFGLREFTEIQSITWPEG
ncbi:MAG TPA: aldehyde dehydrogenase family protein [Myxococcota bacterium]|nr:aldehyde dehydrogenase family protein [Myxococcota bacterium]